MFSVDSNRNTITASEFPSEVLLMKVTLRGFPTSPHGTVRGGSELNSRNDCQIPRSE